MLISHTINPRVSSTTSRMITRVFSFDMRYTNCCRDRVSVLLLTVVCRRRRRKRKMILTEYVRRRFIKYCYRGTSTHYRAHEGEHLQLFLKFFDFNSVANKLPRREDPAITVIRIWIE